MLKKPEKYFDKLVTLWLSTANHFLECYSKVAVTFDVQEQGQIIQQFLGQDCVTFIKGLAVPNVYKNELLRKIGREQVKNRR